jgi:hypothetical protein
MVFTHSIKHSYDWSMSARQQRHFKKKRKIPNPSAFSYSSFILQTKKKMAKGPPIASIIPINNNTNARENYGILSFQNDIADTKSAPVEQTSIIVCTAGIPFDISIPEFLDFVAPVDSSVSHYKIIW